jgi:Disulphide bond corrector protein DsbC
MKSSRSLPCIICLLLFFIGCNKSKATGSNGGSGGPPIVKSSADVVRLGGFGVAFSGPGKGSVDVPIRIDDGYHINANPATFPYLIATEVTTDKVPGLDVGKPIYPPAVRKKFQFADEPLAVYEGNVNITLPLVTHSSGTKSLPISIRVQACDQEKCFAPDTLKTTIPVEVK